MGQMFFLFLFLMLKLIPASGTETKNKVEGELGPSIQINNVGPSTEKPMNSNTNHLIIIGKNAQQTEDDFTFGFGTRITIEARGSIAESLKSELDKGIGLRSPTLFLDGVRMNSMVSSLSQTQDGKK